MKNIHRLRAVSIFIWLYKVTINANALHAKQTNTKIQHYYEKHIRRYNS